jgi:hypothetical protein
MVVADRPVTATEVDPPFTPPMRLPDPEIPPLPWTSWRRLAPAALVVAVALLLVAGTAVWWAGDGDGDTARRDPARQAAGNPGKGRPSDVSSAVASTGAGDLAGREDLTIPGGTGAPQTPGGQHPTTTTTTNPGPGDQFNGTALDTSKWDVYESTNPTGGKWTKSAVRVTGGELQIVGTGRNSSGAGNTSGGLCWCGTGGARTFGIWRVRAKFDTGTGYGQAIGLYPQTNPAVEHYITFANTAQPDRRSLNGWVAYEGKTSDGVVTGDFSGWHTYAVEWRATYVKLSVDDKVFYDSTGKSGVVIPQRPMQLFIQQAIGPSSGVPAANSSTPDQVILHVDWVTYQP